MVQHALGTSTFQKGIYNYLEKCQYSFATEDDLFESLEKAAIQDNIQFLNETNNLSNFLRTWTHNSGFPSLKVTRNYESGEITITQRSNTLQNKLEWYIPITIATTVNSNFDDTTLDLIMPPNRTITINPNEVNKTLLSTDWLILNKKQIGLYNINYDKENWQLIAKQLHENCTIIDVSNRAQIIRDLTSFIKSGSIEMDIVLDIYSYLKYETELLPWQEGAYILREINAKLDNTKTGELFKIFARNIVKPIYLKLQNSTYDTDEPLTDSVRSAVFELACQVDLEECLQYSYSQLKKYLKTGDFFNCFTKSNIICGGVNYASNDEFKLALEKMLSTNDSENVDIFLSPLMCSRNLDNIKILLDSILKNLSLTTEDKDLEALYKITFQLYSTNEFAQLLVLDFYIEHFDELVTDIESFISILETISIYMPNNTEQNTKYNFIVEKITSSMSGEIIDIETSMGILSNLRKKFISKNDNSLRSWLTKYNSNNELNQ